MFVQRTYGVKLPTSILLSSRSTVRDLARIIDRESAASNDTAETLDLVREVEELSHELFEPLNHGPRDTGIARNVFLTGASGHLGIGILQKLLQNPGIQIYASTRSLSIVEALDQIRRRAELKRS